MRDHERWWPLSSTQQGIWLDEKRAPQGSAYSLPFLLTLDGHLDNAAITSACLQVITRHPVLSCSVREGTDGLPRLAVAPRAPEVVTTDFRGARASDLNAILGAAMETEIRKTFDLVNGPLIRLTLFLMKSRPSALLVVGHHLIFDRLSMDIFTRDLAACYESALSGHESALPPVTSGMQAYIAEKERWIAATLPRAREYWSTQWREPTALSLPHASRAAAGMMEGNHTAECTEFLIGKREHALLQATADSMGITKFEYLLAALYALLFRYGNKQPSVSVALGQRTRLSANMIGPFVQEVPFTARMAGDMRFSDFARGLRDDLQALYRFRRFPLGLAVPGANPAAVRSSVSISYARHHFTVATTPMRMTWRFLFNFYNRNPLSISVLDDDKTLRIMLRHSPAFIDAASVANIARQWRRLCYAGAFSAMSRVDELPLLDRVECNRILTLSNAAVVSYPGGTFPQLFSAQASRTPRRIAAISGNENITYARLDAESGRLAECLLHTGVRRGSVAAIFMRPSIRRLVTVLAVLKTGGAYLPLELESPRARVNAIARDAGAAVVLVDGPGEAELAGSDSRVFRVDDFSADPEPHEERAIPCPGHEHDLAYLIYTSGSTGRPKGVAIEHGAVSNVLNGFRDITGTGAGATWLAHTSLAFDMAALELYLPLIAGGTVVIAQHHEVKNASQLLRLVREHRITHLQATPSGWQSLLAAGFDEPDVAAIVGGETLALPLARRLRPRVQRLWNAYGPTEATIWTTYAEIARDVSSVNIGRPIANTRVYILDDRAEIVPIGCTGELFIAGRGLARGYFRQTAWTAEGFVVDPFGAPGERMYRTGDRARYRNDGSIEFLGRLDDQVKVRGHRIELGEVEARLAAHPRVERCAVVARGEEGLNRRLVAFVSLADGQAAPESELRRWLAEVLPPYMLPTAYVTLRQFPITATGKLDRASLPDPEVSGVGGHGEDRRAPSAEGPIEQEIRQICREVLRAVKIGLDDDLFDLDANSLTILQISRRIALRLGVDIPLEMLFEAPTVTGIARLVAEAEQGRQELSPLELKHTKSEY
jgi:amino acid adenylation domain-containing protein